MRRSGCDCCDCYWSSAELQREPRQHSNIPIVGWLGCHRHESTRRRSNNVLQSQDLLQPSLPRLNCTTHAKMCNHCSPPWLPAAEVGPQRQHYLPAGADCRWPPACCAAGPPSPPAGARRTRTLRRVPGPARPPGRRGSQECWPRSWRTGRAGARPHRAASPPPSCRPARSPAPLRPLTSCCYSSPCPPARVPRSVPAQSWPRRSPPTPLPCRRRIWWSPSCWPPPESYCTATGKSWWRSAGRKWSSAPRIWSCRNCSM